MSAVLDARELRWSFGGGMGLGVDMAGLKACLYRPALGGSKYELKREGGLPWLQRCGVEARWARVVEGRAR